VEEIAVLKPMAKVIKRTDAEEDMRLRTSAEEG
jgi:hypothetical protein